MVQILRCPACDQAIVAATCSSCRAALFDDVVDEGGDRVASDRDMTAESRDRAAERRDRGADDRDALTRLHEQSAGSRDHLANDQDQAWSDHDQAASGSDQETADDDQQAADDDYAAGGDPVRYRRGITARDRTRRERGSASVSRDETTAARVHMHGARTDREDILRFAEHDRADAADDREQAARDREGALRDRTDSAAAARRAVETLESMSDAFFTLDPEGRFTYLNPRCETFLKRRREDLVGKVVWEEFPEVAGSRFADEYRRALRDRVPVRFEEAYEPLGRTFEARAYPVTDGLAVYFTDVTDERVRDERQRQAQRLEAIGRVTAGVAHDFNNLLTGIGGFASLGQAAAVDERTSGLFDQIASGCERAVALTRQLLVFAREQDLSPTVIDLNDVVSGLVPMLLQLLPAGVDLRVATSPQPVPVFVDRSQLEQVLLNLVVNSRDAIDTTGAITVSTTPDEPAGVVHDVRVASAWLQVTDTGTGIPEALLPLIFDPFFSTKARETGAGLGLATIYGIVSQSGGSITVDSTVGAGTTMTVALPALATERPEIRAAHG
jgi:PAS domain S-box-containing protein